MKMIGVFGGWAIERIVKLRKIIERLRNTILDTIHDTHKHKFDQNFITDNYAIREFTK